MLGTVMAPYESSSLSAFLDKARCQWGQRRWCCTHRTAYAEVEWACRVLPLGLLAPLVAWRIRTPALLSADIVNWCRQRPSCSSRAYDSVLGFRELRHDRVANR